jgi:rhodanese-related sulfurtransferase
MDQSTGSRRNCARQQLSRARAVRRALGVGMVLLGAFAVVATVPAGEPAPAKAAPAAASVPARLAPMSQEALLEHQAKHPQHLLVLDVRSPEEFKEGHVPGAVNIPYDQMASRLADVPKDKDLVLYCRSGRRAGIAAEVLAANGYSRLSHLEGDMPAWIEKGRPVEMP